MKKPYYIGYICKVCNLQYRVGFSYDYLFLAFFLSKNHNIHIEISASFEVSDVHDDEWQYLLLHSDTFFVKIIRSNVMIKNVYGEGGVPLARVGLTKIVESDLNVDWYMMWMDT